MSSKLAISIRLACLSSWLKDWSRLASTSLYQENWLIFQSTVTWPLSRHVNTGLGCPLSRYFQQAGLFITIFTNMASISSCEEWPLCHNIHKSGLYISNHVKSGLDCPLAQSLLFPDSITQYPEIWPLSHHVKSGLGCPLFHFLQ